MKKIKKTPPRLGRIFQSYEVPLYFVTINTLHRKKILASEPVLKSLIEYGKENLSHARCIGKFVIMPDHIHMFVRLPSDAKLNSFIRLLKQRISMELKTTGLTGPIWQPGFFDHILRHGESYAEKWNYVRQNPVRAGLVASPEDWSFQGEVTRLQM